MKKFKLGKKYKMKSVCDHNCKWEYEVIKRTKKTITIKQIHDGRINNRRVKVCGDSEYISPLGTYSMSPTLRADKEI